jgi:hypothetical protein
LFKNGDIDNRIKTLLDGLRAPQQLTEIPDGAVPAEGEEPFYCLMSDDVVIRGFSVKSDQLLVPSDSSARNEYARVVIGVTVQVARLRYANLPFLAD